MYKKIKYSVEKHNFVKLLKNLYNIETLEMLHESLTSNFFIPDGIKGLGLDTSSIFHRKFYDKLDFGWEEISSLYTKFIFHSISYAFC